MLLTVALGYLLSSILLFQPARPDRDDTLSQVVIDNFEAYDDGGLPMKWKYLHNRKLEPMAEHFMREREKFYIVEEQGNKFVRVYTQGEAMHIMMDTRDDSPWDLNALPYLRWEWRALQLPTDANEEHNHLNDAGAAVYVTFSTDWLGRPRSIKYTYSSTLPVGTIVSYGRLKVIVVSSGADGIGQWVTVERNVLADYERVFGKDAPDRPLTITLWSDSDNTDSTGEADFDNIELLPPPSERAQGRQQRSP